MQLLKQNTAATVLVGPVLDSAGAAVTNAVIGDFQITKNGTSAAMASPATRTHSHNGFYLLSLATGDTDTVGRLVISVNNTAQSMSTHRYMVLLPSVFDALITNATNSTGGLPAATNTITALAGAISTFAGGAVASVTNRVTANVDQWGGVSVTGMPLPTDSYTAPLSAADTRTALGLASANLDTQLADIPTTAEFEARTLIASGYASSTHWTATRAGFLDGVLLADNYNIRVVSVTGSKHVASVVHSVEPAAIPEDAFVDGALSNRVLAANAAAEVATAVRTELAIELGRIDVASSSRLASSAYTAPDNAGITLIKTVTDRLNTGLVQDGAVWQFTVNMLENGPAGGGGGSGDATLANQVLILGQLDLIQNKTDLLNPAPTGSVLLVDSGEFYCTRQDVELIFGKSSVRTWADVDNEGDEDFISDRILTMIALAHEQTNDGLRNGGYVVPFTPPRPASLTYNVAALAGVLLYESRGAIDADNEDGTHRLTPYRKRWDKYIKQLLSQQVRIDATRQNATTAPAVY